MANREQQPARADDVAAPQPPPLGCCAAGDSSADLGASPVNDVAACESTDFSGALTLVAVAVLSDGELSWRAELPSSICVEVAGSGPAGAAGRA